MWPAGHSREPTLIALSSRNCGRFGESPRPLTGLGSGEWYESRFHRKCIDGGHPDIGHRRRVVGTKDFPRHVNRHEAGVEQEASGRRGSRRTHHFRGGGSFPVIIAGGYFARRWCCPLRTAFGHRPGAISARRKQPSIASSPMHFRHYLMIAALFLIGLEAIYSLYQLAMFVL
jgi:hypothetical protein